MKPTLNQLKTFAAVVEEGGITAAARKIHMTQPGVSIQVRQLEEYYHLPLIEQMGKKIYPTLAGKTLYLASQDIFERLASLEMEFSQMQNALKGELNISVVSTAQYFIPGFLGEFHRHFPGVDIRLKVTNRAEVLDRLRNNFDDLVILSQLPENLPVNAERFLKDELVIAASPEHPFSKMKNLSLKDLENEPFILRELGSGTRILMEKLFKKYRFNPRIVMEMGSGSAIKQSIMANFGISMLSKKSLEQELSLKKLSILNVVGFPVPYSWYIVFLKKKNLSPVAANFLKFLKSKMS